jgi:methylphosphotriester-DNA--protein-cysteine methyltransferase
LVLAEQVVDNSNLGQLAAQAGLSKFHFHRLFKKAMACRLPAIRSICGSMLRRLLRETKKSVVTVAFDVASLVRAISRSSSGGKPAFTRPTTVGRVSLPVSFTRIERS